MKKITQTLKHKIGVVALTAFATLLCGIQAAWSAPASFTKTSCVTSDAISTDVTYKNSLQAMLLYYNWDLDPNMRFCQNNIALQGKDNVINLTKAIEIKVTPNSGSLVFGGADAEHPITLNAEKIGAQECAIKISGSKIKIQNIILLKSPKNGICVGSKELTSQPSDITFSNIVVSRSQDGDGFKVADGAKNINFDKGTKATYNNNGYGIEFLGDMNGATSSYVFYSPTDPYGSVSLFQNKKALKTGEKKVLKFSNVYVNPTQIQGEVEVCSADGSSCTPAPIVGVLVHRVYSKATVENNMFASFVGVGRPQNNISGNFMLKFDSTLATLQGDHIEMIPIWSESNSTNSGQFTVLGSSSKEVEVKFNTDLSEELNDGSSVGTGTDAKKPPVESFACSGGVIEKYKSFLTMVQLPNGKCYPVLADRLSGFQDKTSCNAFVSAMQTNPTDSGVLKSVDSDLDGISDAKEDRNHNCNVDAGESDWTKPDSDNDGVMDREEADTKGYMSCFKNLDKVCSKTKGIITCTDASIDISSVEEQRNPGESKTEKLHLVVPFKVDIDQYGAACTKGYPGEISGTCATTANYVSIDQDPARRGRPNGFSVTNGDFCTQTDPSNPDTDFDGLSDGREQRGMVFKKLDKSRLYTIATDTFKKEKSDLTGEECALSAAASDPNTGSGREVVQRSYDATKADGTMIPLTVDLICMSDSVDHKHYSTLGLDDQTDPRNPDTDNDGWCDGTAGNKTNSGCVGKKGTDLCPRTPDLNNSCFGDSSANNVYNYIDSAKKTALIAAIKDFKGAAAGGGNARQALLNELKSIDTKGDPTHDTDQDGIPDIVENPDGLSVTPDDVQNQGSTGTIYTDPFRIDSDTDGKDDAHDPCPRDKNNSCETASATSGCAKGVITSYASQKALCAFMDWDNDKLYNSEENPNCDITLDAGETCPDVADSEGDGLSDFYEYLFKTNPWVKDTDSDGLDDAAEVGLDGNTNSLNVQLMTGTVGCFSENSEVKKLTKPLAGDTDPTKGDTDGDGILDGVEMNDAGSNPLNPDSDGDELCDGDVTVAGVCVAGENLLKGKEFPHYPSATEAGNLAALTSSLGAGYTYKSDGLHSSNPCATDTDHDGQRDDVDKNKVGDKLSSSFTKFGPDSDVDGIPDKIENDIGTNPENADTDGDGLEDGCVNIGQADMRGELCAHLTKTEPAFNDLSKAKPFDPTKGDTNPFDADTDHDGMKDGDELAYPDGKYKGIFKEGVSLNPLKEDTDNDGILDGIEAGARFKSNGAGVCKDGICCRQNGVEAVKAGNLDPAVAASPFYTSASTTNALTPDTDEDGLPDGNLKNYIAPNIGKAGEDLNCNGVIDLDKDNRPKELDPRAADSNSDGMKDGDAICQNGTCDVVTNLPYGYAHQSTGACSNTLMPTVPASPRDLATLLMMLSPLGVALRMRMRRKK